MDKNIIPAIVPPISIEKELNKTPLISKQAQYINSDKFVSTFLKDLVRKGVVEHWIYMDAVNFEIGSKLKFKINRLVEQGNNHKAFSLKTWYELH